MIYLKYASKREGNRSNTWRICWTSACIWSKWAPTSPINDTSCPVAVALYLLLIKTCTLGQKCNKKQQTSCILLILVCCSFSVTFAIETKVSTIRHIFIYCLKWKVIKLLHCMSLIRRLLVSSELKAQWINNFWVWFYSVLLATALREFSKYRFIRVLHTFFLV